MRIRGLICVLAVLLVACGPKPGVQAKSSVTSGSVTRAAVSSSPLTTASAAPTNPPTVPSQSPLPVCTNPVPVRPTALSAVYMVDITQYPVAPSGVTSSSTFANALHVVTVINQVASDRVIYISDQIRHLLAVGMGFAIEIDGQGDGTDPLAMVDLQTSARCSLGTMNSLGIDDVGRDAAVVSPDGSQLAIGSAHKIVLIQLPSGSERTLVGPGEPNTWLLPLRWTAMGILVAAVGYEGLGYGQLTLVDPLTGSLSVVMPGATQLAVSPSGRWLATTTNVNLGDTPTLKYAWQNTIDLTPYGGSTSQIVAEKDRWFKPLDVSDIGQVLFSSDTQVVGTGPVTADMGLYLATNGNVVQQLAEGFVGEFGNEYYGAASFLDSTTAVVARMRGGFQAESSLDVELVHLCAATSGACRATTTTVSSTPGSPPTDVREFFVVPAAN